MGDSSVFGSVRARVCYVCFWHPNMSWAELSLISAERHWTAQPKHLHSAEVPDEQVGIQQLQLGGQLTSAVRVHPQRRWLTLNTGRTLHSYCLDLQIPPLLLQIPSPVSRPSTCATLPVVRGGAVLREPAMQWCMMGGSDGREGADTERGGQSSMAIEWHHQEVKYSFWEFLSRYPPPQFYFLLVVCFLKEWMFALCYLLPSSFTYWLEEWSNIWRWGTGWFFISHSQLLPLFILGVKCPLLAECPNTICQIFFSLVLWHFKFEEILLWIGRVVKFIFYQI